VLTRALVLLMLSLPALADIELVKVDKSENRMFLIAGGEVVKEFHVALGGNPKGHKIQEGDKRTPEGRYTFDYKKEDSAFYRAMHISYPNEEDIARAEALGVSPGGFIMIHGQSNESKMKDAILQRFNWTDGCIALTNPEMDEFMDLVDVGTPVEIVW
jgi:murein L,D-transpeptidase YafK